jgi:uncharacterized protein (DUF2267 family)
MSEPKIIETSAHKAREWLAAMAAELGTDDRHYAYRALRAYLHAVRDRITVEEAAQLGAQLPLLIRGVYYDGWVPARTPASYHTVDEFLVRVAEEAQLAGETEASLVCRAGSAVLRQHVSEGEIEDVIAVMPESLRPLLAT